MLALGALLTAAAAFAFGMAAAPPALVAFPSKFVAEAGPGIAPAKPEAEIEVAHPLYIGLQRGLLRYRERFGRLPELDLQAGPPLRPGQSGERVALLRRRLGLAPGDGYDEALAGAVREWQLVHGQPPDGVAGADTVASLNLGSAHYERVVRANLERARRLPSGLDRHVLVDAGAARLWLFERDRAVDSMRVVVGSRAHPTPMLEGLIGHAEIDPYWNVPEDMVRTRIAPRVLAEGLSYLRDRRYELLSDWSEAAAILDPASVDWQAVADGRRELRVRQRPGPANAMGEIKFVFPNTHGVSLHDTPDRSVFARADRWISNGCVRLEDAWRLARWLFGDTPLPGAGQAAQNLALPVPVPLFITYLTAAPADDGLVFRPDVYGRDPAPGFTPGLADAP